MAKTVTPSTARREVASDPAMFHPVTDVHGNCTWCKQPATPGTLCPALLDPDGEHIGPSIKEGRAYYDRVRATADRRVRNNTIGGGSR